MAFVAIVPMSLVFSEGNLWVNFFGLLYIVWLCIWLHDSETGRRFLRRYYHEILRLENNL